MQRQAVDRAQERAGACECVGESESVRGDESVRGMEVGAEGDRSLPWTPNSTKRCLLLPRCDAALSIAPDWQAASIF